MWADDRTPLTPAFLLELAELEAAYLREVDPIVQSGFHGGPERWRAERGAILAAITMDGDLLDIGCANGYLLECLTRWAAEREITLTPHGLDQGAGLIALARERLPEHAANLHIGNAWNWQPPRLYRYVYTLLDVVPPEFEAAYLRRVLDEFVAPGGRLIAGDYGSRSRSIPPRDVAGVFRGAGLAVAGQAFGGDPVVTAFAWADRG